jgi:hypothetical protein
MKDATFTNTKNDIERQAWRAFIEVIKKFLLRVNVLRYKRFVENMLEKLRVLLAFTSGLLLRQLRGFQLKAGQKAAPRFERDGKKIPGM